MGSAHYNRKQVRARSLLQTQAGISTRAGSALSAHTRGMKKGRKALARISHAHTPKAQQKRSGRLAGATANIHAKERQEGKARKYLKEGDGGGGSGSGDGDSNGERSTPSIRKTSDGDGE